MTREREQELVDLNDAGDPAELLRLRLVLKEIWVAAHPRLSNALGGSNGTKHVRLQGRNDQPAPSAGVERELRLWNTTRKRIDRLAIQARNELLNQDVRESISEDAHESPGINKAPDPTATKLVRARAWREMYRAAEAKALRYGDEIKAMVYAQFAADWDVKVQQAKAKLR